MDDKIKLDMTSDDNSGNNDNEKKTLVITNEQYARRLSHLKFVVGISVTLWAIILGTYANVINQHSWKQNWSHWIWPSNVVEFINDQKLLNDSLLHYEQEVRIPKKNGNEQVQYHFIVDRTTHSIQENIKLKNYLIDRIELLKHNDNQPIIDELRRDGSFRSAMLYGVLAFEVPQGQLGAVYHYSGDTIWNMVWPSQENERELGGGASDALESFKKIHELGAVTSRDGVNTDISRLLEPLSEISRQYGSNSKIIVNIISDFNHNGGKESFVRQGISEVLAAQDKKIDQINLFILPGDRGLMYDNSLIYNGLQSALLNTEILSYEYKDIFAKDGDVPSGSEIKSHLLPAQSVHSDEIVFYKPFHTRKNHSAYRCFLKVVDDEGKQTEDFMLYLRNSIRNHHVGFQKRDKNGENLEIGGGVSPFRIRPGEQTFELSCNGYDPYYDRFYAELKSNSGDFKFRYPVRFKDKMPLTSIYLFLLFYTIAFSGGLILMGNWLLYWFNKWVATKLYKIFWMALPMISFLIVLAIWWSQLKPLGSSEKWIYFGVFLLLVGVEVTNIREFIGEVREAKKNK